MEYSGRVHRDKEYKSESSVDAVGEMRGNKPDQWFFGMKGFMKKTKTKTKTKDKMFTA